jgi:RNA methyltransferase, TrmH family
VTDLVTSTANPTVKRVRLLAERKHRRRQEAFVVEGLQPVWRAVTAGRDLEVLIVAPELLTQPDATRMVDEQEAAGVRVVRVSRDLFLRLSERDGPAGLMAIVRGSIGGLADFHPPAGSVVVALHQPANPGNIGTIVRTADATGAGAVVLVGRSADPLAPASVKASMGSVFALPVAQTADADELFAWATHQQRPVYAVTGGGRHDHWSVDYPRDVVLLLGSEGPGLPDDVADRCDDAIRIPMVGTAESLNLAAAASVVLYEVARRKLRS